MDSMPLRTMSCTICAQMAGVDGRYIERLEKDSRMRQGLSDALVRSMGFCAFHTQFLRDSGRPMGGWAITCASNARVRLAGMFSRAKLQDEVLQDIVFGARTRCPACAFYRRLEGRLLSRTLREVESKRTSIHTFFLTSLCFVHAASLVERADGTVRRGMSIALRKKGERLLEKAASAESDAAPNVAEVADGLIDDIFPIGRRYMFSLEPRVAGSDQPARHVCPVCEEMLYRCKNWTGMVCDNILMEQPFWLALPTCPEHVVMCLADAGGGVQGKIVQHYIESFFARWIRPRPNPARRKRRRLSHEWGTLASARGGALSDVSNEVADTLNQNTILGPNCPGCRHMDIAMRIATSSFLRISAKVSDASAPVHSLCEKHIAEALIYAEDTSVQARIVACLRVPSDGMGSERV